MSRPSKLYLVSYNSLQSLGWFIALLRLLPCLAPPFPVHSAYAVAGDLICFLQACAILETVHAAIGLVPTAPLLAFLQWGGRTHFILAVVGQIPEVQRSPSVFITLIAWSISEVIRYSHYALTTLKVCPEWLTYLRFRRVHYVTRLELASDKYNAQFTASQISCQLKKMHSCQEVHCFYPAVSNRGWPRRNVDYVSSSPICEEEEPLLRFLQEVLHELPFISSGCAGALSVHVAEAVLACVQTTQVQAGKGEQEETSLR